MQVMQAGTGGELQNPDDSAPMPREIGEIFRTEYTARISDSSQARLSRAFGCFGPKVAAASGAKVCRYSTVSTPDRHT